MKFLESCGKPQLITSASEKTFSMVKKIAVFIIGNQNCPIHFLKNLPSSTNVIESHDKVWQILLDIRNHKSTYSLLSTLYKYTRISANAVLAEWLVQKLDC